MNNKVAASTENTEYYYVDGHNIEQRLDSVWPSEQNGFWYAIRSSDKLQITVHYSTVHLRDLRFNHSVNNANK